jgi:hypothetical protein
MKRGEKNHENYKGEVIIGTDGSGHLGNARIHIG